MNIRLCRSLLAAFLLMEGLSAHAAGQAAPKAAIPITHLENNVATLAAGSRAGLKAPMELKVFQDGVEAGRIVLASVQEDSATGRVFSYVHKKVQPGDLVRLGAGPATVDLPTDVTVTGAPGAPSPAASTPAQPVEVPAPSGAAASGVPVPTEADITAPSGSEPPTPADAEPADAASAALAAPSDQVSAPVAAPAAMPNPAQVAQAVGSPPSDVPIAAPAPASPAEGDAPVAQAGQGAPYPMGASPATPTPPATPTTETPPPPPPAEPAKTVSNVFTDTDIREVLAEVASQAGVSIILDDSVKAQSISVEFNNDTVQQAVAKVALFGGLVWKERSPGVFILSAGTPDSPLFREFTVSRRYMPENQTAETVAALVSASYKPYVSVDKTTNVIGITAPEQLMDRIMEDIHAMDAPSRQFVVEALIAELTADSGTDFGFSWNWNQFGIDADLNLNYAKATSLDIARLKALISNGTATLRANPRISAFEGRPATLNVGTETYFSILTGNVNFPTSQIQVIRTGVTLTVTGFIGEDGYITLNLSPEVGDFAASVDGNPTVTIRRANTNIRVKSGETIVIGGLIQDGSIKSTSKVPILGEIPLIGKLFTRSSTSKRRTDVVMMITPRITEDGAGLAGADDRLGERMLQSPAVK